MATPPSPDRHLEGWKEIAAYFGKAARTVQRWEKELGLPVHRRKGPGGGQTPYAYRDELDAWFSSAAGRQGAAEPPDIDGDPEQDLAAEPRTEPTPQTGTGRRRVWLPLLGLAALALGAFTVTFPWFRSNSAVTPASTSRVAVAAGPGMGLDPGPWPVAGHDARQSHQSHFSGPATPTLPRVVFEAPQPLGFGGPEPVPLVVDSKGLLIMGWPGEVVAISRAGTRAWTTALRHPGGTIVASGFAVAASGQVTVSTHAFDAPYVYRTGILVILNGKIVNEREQFGIVAPPTIGADRTAYVIDEVCAVRAYRESGENYWTTILAGYSCSTPSLDSVGNLYFGTDGGLFNHTSVWSLAPDGKVRWTRETSGGFSVPAVSLDDRIFVANREGELLALTPSGKELWRRGDLPTAPSSRPLSLDAQGNLYYRFAGGVAALDSRDGKTRWQFPDRSNGITSSFVVLDADGNVYFGGDAAVYSLTPGGQLRWRVPVADPGTLVIGGDRLLYVVSEWNRILAIEEDRK